MNEETRKAIAEEKELMFPSKKAEMPKGNKVNKLMDTQETELLKDGTIKKWSKTVVQEGIKADLAKEGAKIHRKNVETAETQFETETREQRLKQLKAELALDHKYKMSIIEANGKHKAMLDRRIKLEEKYGYLYKVKDIVDDDGNVIRTELVDFSYSNIVNKLRTFTRNISKLDTTVKKSLKWIIIIGGGIAIIAILKSFNIIN